MSEQVTHMAVFDDCRRLALADPDFLCRPFVDVLERRHDAARLGTLSRGNNRRIVPMVKKARERWDEREGEERFERTLAFALGWYAHRATDRTFKPLYREVDPRYEERDVNWVKVYHDAVLLDAVYGGGGTGPYPEGYVEVAMGSHPGTDAVDLSAVEDLFAAKWTQEWLGAFEFAGGPPGEGFADEALDARQTATYRFSWYEEAYHDPDPRRVQSWLNEPNFYDETDPLVAEARALQRGEDVEVDARERAAAASDGGGSQYAEALARAVRYLAAASDFFEGEATERELGRAVSLWWYDRDPDHEADTFPDAGETSHPHRHQPLAEVALVEDCARLALVDGALSGRYRDVLVDHRDAALAAGVAAPGEWLVGALDDPRSRFHFRRENADEKFAFAGGSLCYAAARTRFRDGGEAVPSEASVARDVAVLRGRTSRADPDAADAGELTDLFAGLFPRTRQRWHTLKPDVDHPEPWLARVYEWRAAEPAVMRRYAETYAADGGAGEEFYDETDPLVRLARSTRDAATGPPVALADALDGARDRCTYAAALAAGLEHLRAVDRYVAGEGESEDGRAALANRVDDARSGDPGAG